MFDSEPVRASRAAILEPLESRRLLNAGDLDTSFGTSGEAYVQFPGQAMSIQDVAVGPDGSVVVAGSKAGNVVVARLKPDGTVDTAFASGGLYESSLPASSKLQVVVQSDNKPIIAYPGSAFFGISPSLVRLTASGLTDSTFGSGGSQSLNLDASSPDLAVILQNDGKILVAGRHTASDIDFGILRMNTDGSPDSLFGNFGEVDVGFGDFEWASALAIDYNGTPASNPFWGSIVAVGGHGTSSPAVKICRLTSAGQLDPNFDGDGKLTSPQLSPADYENAIGVQIQPGGKIVVAGSAVTASGEGDFLLARYLSGGQLDSSFGPNGNGVVQTDLENGGDDVARESATSYVGGILVSGKTGFGASAVVAYTRDGFLDTRFSGDGIRTSSLSGPATIATTGNNIMPIRRILVAGGNSVLRLIDVGSVVAIGSFDPNSAEAGPDSATIFVGRTERLGTTERVYINVGGTATPPYRLNADYTVSGMTLVNPLQGPSYIDIPPNQTIAAATITPTDDTRVEGDETIIFSISSGLAYDIGTPPSTTLAIRDNDISGGPTVSSSAFVYDSGPPQRVRFTFSQDVAFSIGGNDFSLTGPAGAVPFSFNYDNIANTATLNFSSVLENGNYAARAIAAGITNASGAVMPADSVLDFFFLNADGDHDGKVDLTDFTILAANFNQTGRIFSQGNFDYDPAGKVDLTDFTILAANFNKTLAAGSAAMSLSFQSPAAAPVRRDLPATLCADERSMQEDLLA